jgi:glycosyltransferase involved in cell wall biosynthesis
MHEVYDPLNSHSGVSDVANPKRNPQRMRVLLLSEDIYASVGGGQTFYQRLIENYPDIDFTCLATKLTKEVIPQNVTILNVRRAYRISGANVDVRTNNLAEAFSRCLNIAYTLRGQTFDIVDYPDYSLVGLFIRPSFQMFGVVCSKFVLSMHGLISSSFKRSWFFTEKDQNSLAHLERMERQMLESADIRYGISESYIEEARQQFKCKFELLDVVQILDRPNVVEPTNQPTNQLDPKIAFIGRLEKRKGIDLAIDMVANLPRELRRRLYIVGPDEVRDDQKASDIIKDYAAVRNVEVELLGSLSQRQLKEFFSTATVVILPSRYDTFNLAAWETLAAGIPTLVGEAAGIVSFLRSRFPRVPFYTIQPERIGAATSALANAIKNYEKLRSELIAGLKESDLRATRNLKEIYLCESKFDERVRDELEAQFRELRSLFKVRNSISLKGLIRMWALESTPMRVARAKATEIKSAIRTLRRPRRLLLGVVTRIVSRLGQYDKIKEYGAILHAYLWKAQGWKNRRANRNVEINEIDIINEKRLPRISRVDAYRFMSYLASSLEKYQVAAAYGIRSLRWSRLTAGSIADTSRWLAAAGFGEEAKVLQLMASTPDQVTAYLDSRIKALLKLPSAEFEVVENNRPIDFQPKVTIVVSAYRVSNKIDYFFKMLAAQTLNEKRLLEVVIIDSGSPEGITHFKDIVDSAHKHGLTFFAARTAKRETIQAAWNRALTVALSDYVAFLGVDEAMTPAGFEELAEFLDAHQDVDWVTGDSVVTEVKMTGEWVKDVMTYRRTNLARTDHILESCYFAYVGSLYRKSIHARVGWYDETFTGAGDTEFKNRSLPFIKVAHVPKLLGTFLNYPEARVTQAPRAEIEDLRAWYVFRSAGGLMHLTKTWTDDEIRELLIKCFSYRKSYCGHASYDLEVASNLEAVIESRPSLYKELDLVKIAQKMEAALTALETAKAGSGKLFSYLKCRQEFDRSLKQLKKVASLKRNEFRILHENRFEQHANQWPF